MARLHTVSLAAWYMCMHAPVSLSARCASRCVPQCVPQCGCVLEQTGSDSDTVFWTKQTLLTAPPLPLPATGRQCTLPLPLACTVPHTLSLALHPIMGPHGMPTDTVQPAQPAGYIEHDLPLLPQPLERPLRQPRQRPHTPTLSLACALPLVAPVARRPLAGTHTTSAGAHCRRTAAR